MAFHKTKTDKVSKEQDGIVYLLQMIVDGKEVVKIGVTGRSKIEERVVEILTSHFKSYRHFPYCYPKRFKKTTSMYDKEAQLHYHFDKVKYTSEKPFGGSTEIFIIDDIEYLKDVYARCLDGENIRELDQYEADDVLED